MKAQPQLVKRRRLGALTKLQWQEAVPSLAVNERDELGSDLVPDYMTSVRDGGFCGWPYS